MAKSKNVFVGSVVKTVGVGMAHILYGKGKTLIARKKGYHTGGSLITKEQTEKWGNDWNDVITFLNGTYGKGNYEFRYRVAI